MVTFYFFYCFERLNYLNKQWTFINDSLIFYRYVHISINRKFLICKIIFFIIVQQFVQHTCLLQWLRTFIGTLKKFIIMPSSILLDPLGICMDVAPSLMINPRYPRAKKRCITLTHVIFWGGFYIQYLIVLKVFLRKWQRVLYLNNYS